MKVSLDRRSFLRRTAGGAILPAAASGLLAACTEEGPDGVLTPRLSKVGNAGLGGGGYGPLDNDQGVVLLPRGFQVRSFGAIGDPMSDGHPTPLAPDGMGAFDAGPGACGSSAIMRTGTVRASPSDPTPTTR
jgi:secreted PhoX family phosphatase